MKRMVHDGTRCSYKDAFSLCVRGDCRVSAPGAGAAMAQGLGFLGLREDSLRLSMQSTANHTSIRAGSQQTLVPSPYSLLSSSMTRVLRLESEEPPEELRAPPPRFCLCGTRPWPRARVSPAPQLALTR